MNWDWGEFFIFNALCDAFNNNDDTSSGCGCFIWCLVIIVILALMFV